MKEYKYLKQIKKFIGTRVEYDTYGGGYIWGYDKNDGSQMIGQVEDVEEPPIERETDNPIVSIRGWGAVQHLFKTYDECKEFQDELGEFICEAINEKLKK